MAKGSVDHRQTTTGLEGLRAAPVPEKIALEQGSMPNIARIPGVVIPDGMELRPAVRAILEAMALSPSKPTSWRGFTSVMDWKQFLDLHPEWKGRSIGQLQVDRLSGGLAFAYALSFWLRKQSGGDPEQRLTLIREVFPDYKLQRDWSSFTTLRAWKVEFSRHPTWHGCSMNQLKSDRSGGGQAFLAAFLDWANAKSLGDPDKRHDLIRAIFPHFVPKNIWSELQTITDWKREVAKHPEWRNLSMTQIRSSGNVGDSAFIDTFKKWAKREAQDNRKRYVTIIRQVFPEYREPEPTKELKTIKEWKAAIRRYPTWQGLTISQLKQSGLPGSSPFVDSFRLWVAEQAGEDVNRRSALIRKLFPEYRERTDWSKLKSIEAWKEEFDRHPGWRGLSTGQIRKHGDEGNAFIQAFQKWAKDKFPSDSERRQMLVRELFPDFFTPMDRSKLMTIGAWKKEFSLHSEWQGKSITQLRREIPNGGAAFVHSFLKWIDSANTIDPKQRTRLIKSIFPQYQEQTQRTKWRQYSTLEAWKGELLRHPDWADQSIHKLGNDHVNGGRIFVDALRGWAMRETQNNRLHARALMSHVLPFHKRGMFERWFRAGAGELDPRNTKDNDVKAALSFPERKVVAYKLLVFVDDCEVMVWSVNRYDAPLMRTYLNEVVSYPGIKSARRTFNSSILSGMKG